MLMPCVTFPIDPAIGPVLDIGIAAPLSLIASQSAVQMPPPIHWIKAIADTGCSHTSIHSSVASLAGLSVISQALAQSTMQIATINVYLCDLFVRLIYGQTVIEYAFRDRPISELLHRSTTHDALLGMDLIGLGTFFTNGLTRTATFCW
jgi:hypothetical protein